MRVKQFILIITLLIFGNSLTFGNEMEELKLEVQKLKERVTELNNLIPNRDSKNWGYGFSIDLPIGFYTDDVMMGFNLNLPLSQRLLIRFDGNFIFEQGDEFFVIAAPAIGFIGKIPITNQIRYYTGIFLGITQELNQKKRGPYLLMKIIGGIEFLKSEKKSYFLEIGGGTNYKDFDYGHGVFAIFGTKFYF